MARLFAVSIAQYPSLFVRFGHNEAQTCHCVGENGGSTNVLCRFYLRAFSPSRPLVASQVFCGSSSFHTPPMGLHIAVYPIGINYSVILFHSSVGFARPLLTMTVLRGREPHDAYSPLPMSVASMKRSSPGLSIFARPNSINIRPMPHR